ncbi:hypothetical protein HanIR_Chr10g0458351 [Helianthus annuus]|nr:hypothetical protein HanIR_Chr10g0458351 [Helianthus annuus]
MHDLDLSSFAQSFLFSNSLFFLYAFIPICNGPQSPHSHTNNNQPSFRIQLFFSTFIYIKN